MKYLVDANVLSEPTKPTPERRVIDWLRDNEAELVVNAIVLGEIEYGILLLPRGRKKAQLQLWFAEGVRRVKTIDFDRQCASAWATLLARLKREGLRMPTKDSLVAATALAHGLTVATRNVADFSNAGVPLTNPFEA